MNETMTQGVDFYTYNSNQNQSKQIKTNQNQSKSIKINQNQSKPIKTNQNQSKPIKTYLYRAGHHCHDHLFFASFNPAKFEFFQFLKPWRLTNVRWDISKVHIM